MGSILSKIYDDEKEYEYLCKKYSEKPEDLYSDHYNWIIDKHNKKTNITYEQYSKICSEKRKQNKKEKIISDIKRLQEQLKNL